MAADDPTTARLTLDLFGHFAARVDGVPLSRLRTRRGAWLLALLALREGHPVARSWLAATLWPDSSERQALTNLRVSLKDLRRALGQAASRLRSPTLHTLALDLCGVDVDVLAFDAVVGREDLPSLERAVSLYRGPLLEGCAEEWAFEERQAREQAYLGALERLSERALGRGDQAAAEGHLRRALAVDPLRESGQRALMQLLAAGGNYAAALQVYRELRLLLHRELNAEPDPGTRALFEQIRSEARGEGRGGRCPPQPYTRHNLPLSLTSFIGRQEPMAEVHRLLDHHRLVTLTGTGGVGKTRLALQVATHLLQTFSDGVWLVELASLAGSLSSLPTGGYPTRVPQTVAAALAVREQPGSTLTATLVKALESRELLLLLDNCEHLVGACAELAAALLQACPRLRILVTSREPLGVAGERLYRVPSFPESEAVRLFVDRASSVMLEWTLKAADAPAVAAICERLDGIPLAIELAAAWVKVLPVEEIAARLDDRFRLLTGGSRTSPPRQQTLRALIDWSYGLLSDAERVLLRRLSVFAGGWTLAAAEWVAALPCPADRPSTADAPSAADPLGDRGQQPSPGAFIAVPDGDGSSVVGRSAAVIRGDEILDLLSRLVDKSLVIVEVGRGQRRRYRLLETVRQYARDRLLEADEAESVRRRHRDWFLDLAEQAEPELSGAEQGTWLDQLEEEHDNLRAALAWSSDSSQIEAGLRLGTALRGFWFVRGYFTEGSERITSLLALSDPAERTAVRARALRTAGELIRFRGDYEAARSFLEESLAIQRELGNRKETVQAIVDLVLSLHSLDEYEAARPLIEEGLAMQRETGQTMVIAYLHTTLGDDAFQRGDYEAACSAYEESLRIKRQVGDRHGMGWSLSCLARVARRQGDEGRAAALYQESLALYREVGEPHGIALCLQGLASFAAAWGDCKRAARLYGAAAALGTKLGVPLLPLDHSDHEHRIAQAREALGDAAFTSVWAVGQGMTLEAAVCLALAELESRMS